MLTMLVLGGGCMALPAALFAAHLRRTGRVVPHDGLRRAGELAGPSAERDALSGQGRLAWMRIGGGGGC